MSQTERERDGHTLARVTDRETYSRESSSRDREREGHDRERERHTRANRAAQPIIYAPHALGSSQHTLLPVRSRIEDRHLDSRARAQERFTIGERERASLKAARPDASAHACNAILIARLHRLHAARRTTPPPPPPPPPQQRRRRRKGMRRVLDGKLRVSPYPIVGKDTCIAIPYCRQRYAYRQTLL